MRRKTLAEEHPELVPQWGTSNELSPSDVSSGSHKKVWWTCEKGHSWEATIKNRALLGSGCPYCEHRAVLKGFNDLQTVNPNVARTWSPKNTLKPSDVSPSSNTTVLWICKNGHEWSARIADRNEGHGCPYCSGNAKKWDKDTCEAEAHKYEYFFDFRIKSSGAYNVALRNGWLYDYVWLHKLPPKPNDYDKNTDAYCRAWPYTLRYL